MKRIVALLIAASAGISLFADEGMWMIGDVNRRTQEISKAVVSIDFMGTGSLISENGLVITNHHVAYGDVFALSTSEHNYLENGFWARSMEEEIPIPGRHVQILQKMIDVTDEVQGLFADGTVKPGPMAIRKLSGVIESKYEKEYGLTASLGSFWSGSKYYVSLYKDYADVRLVAAPPVCIGAFGGDVDNWEWPQQKGDFAMLRIYTAPDGSSASYSAENVPLKSPAFLKISDKGYRNGSKATVIGYPGHTDRFASSSKVEYITDVTRPIITEVRGGQMAIISKWMNSDPEVRLKYSDAFFMMSNAQELYEGEMICYKRFKVADEKRAQEKELQEWIDADESRKAEYGTLLQDLETKYKAVYKADRDVNWFRECLIRGSKLHVVASRLSSVKPGQSQDRLATTRTSSRKTYEAIDLRVERDIFRYTMEAYFENTGDDVWGPFQKELKAKFGKDYDAMCAYLWDDSWMCNSEGIDYYLAESTPFSEENLAKWRSDRLYRFFEDVQYVTLNRRSRDAQGTPDLNALDKKYTQAIYKMSKDKKKVIYANANSTLRVTFGKVCGFSPKDAVWCDWKSSVAGLLEKHNPAEHDFCLNPEWKAALEKADPSMSVDFLTDNDITGGNSGSPVVNSKGELIGLCFDGNKESLAGDTSFTTAYNRCVNVDIRFVIWTLRNYAHLDNILSEINK